MLQHVTETSKARPTRKRTVKLTQPAKATRAIGEAADRRWLLADHPADCIICNGASEPDTIILLHKQYQAALAERWREASAQRKSAAAAAYYVGGYKMVIDGTAIRMAAHVKGWKPVNKKGLCKGFEPKGLGEAPRWRTLHSRVEYHWAPVWRGQAQERQDVRERRWQERDRAFRDEQRGNRFDLWTFARHVRRLEAHS